MAEEPEEMLPEERVAASARGEDGRVRDAIGCDEGYAGAEYGQGQQEEDRRSENAAGEEVEGAGSGS